MSVSDQSMVDLVEGFRNRNITITLQGEKLGIRAPKGALNDDDNRLLALNKQQLLEHLRQADCTDQPFPLTEIQTAYWVGRQSSVLGGVGCHAYREFELADIDLNRLQQAWNKVVSRHDMLRAIFTDEGKQQILNQVPVYEISIVDVSDDDDPNARRDQIRETMSHHVFDAAKWPLFDIRVTRLEAVSCLHMGIDLLIADAASILMIYREWHHFYKNPNDELPLPAKKFSDFVRTGGPGPDEIATAEQYWRGRLKNLPGPPLLPLAVSPSEIGAPRFSRRTISLSARQWETVSGNARAAGMTPSTLLLSAYADVLAAFSRTQHFMITLTTFGAPSEYAGVVGDFTSTLLVEVEATLPSFIDRAMKIQESLVAGLEYNGWSGVRVARERARLNDEADAAIPVVFTSALGHQDKNAQGGPLDWLGESIHSITQTPQVWIDHHVIEDSQGLSLSFDMVEQLFSPELTDSIVEAYQSLLLRLAEDDVENAWQVRLGDHLPKRDLLERASANDTEWDYTENLLTTGILSIDDNRPAVTDPSGTLSFGELRAKAAAVANCLHAHKVEPGSLVGIFLPKSNLQILAVLGALLADTAYLPIPAGSPELRRNRLIEHGKVKFVLTERALSDAHWPHGVSPIYVDEIDQAEAETAMPLASPDALAYVIFTSGSSGDPKGVMIEHKAASNTVEDINRRFGVTSKDVVFGLSDLGFDLSVYDVFGLLGLGGQLILPDPERMRDPAHWSHLLREHCVTVWNSVPALASMLLEHDGGVYPDLKLFLLSGDWVPVDLPGRLRRIAPNARVIALGGATEASIWSNYFDTADLAEDARTVPYGWPLANQRFHVLNEALEACPTGVTGGLYIAGNGLARGYLADTNLTEAKFFNHPVTGERLYSTGDLGRYVAGGSIEFLGRKDAQVKIGGYRIELGEVETALTDHPDVSEAAAFVSGTGSQGRLLACVVTKSQTGSAYSPAAENDIEQGILSTPAERLDFRLKHQTKLPFEAKNQRVKLSGMPELGTPERRSTRQFSAVQVQSEAIAQLLSCLGSTAGPDGQLYRYPSAGSTYPVRAWLHVKPNRCCGLSGLYMYDPGEHELECASDSFAFAVDDHVTVNRAMMESAAFAIYLVVDMREIEPLYGKFARDFSLIETGAMSQLLMEQACGAGLGLCLTGALDTSPLATIMQLNENRFLAMTIVGGIPGNSSDTVSTSEGIAQQLKSHLAERLPGYMVPERILIRDSIPLTANGKVDRKALGTLGIVADRMPTEVADGATEEAVAEIFARVLGRPHVGRNDVVFDLGGTSIHIVRIHNLLNSRFQTPLDIVDIFRAPSVAGIAARLVATSADTKAADAGNTRGAMRRRPTRERRRDGDSS